MYKNYLVIAFRNLWRFKAYSLINILGLAAGMTGAILISLYIAEELRYDSHHPNVEQTYRIGCILNLNGKVERAAFSPAPMAPKMFEDYPEVVNYCRFIPQGEQSLLHYNDTKMYLENVYAADSTAPQIFGLEFVQGDPSTALHKPYTIVLTEETARRLFGSEDPMGQTINLNQQADFSVTGVIKNTPRQTHLPLTALVSFATVQERVGPQLNDSWGNLSVYAYIVTTPGFDPERFISEHYPKFFETYMTSVWSLFEASFDIMMHRIDEIHLRSDLQWEPSPTGDVAYLYVFSAIGLFLLLIAAINYMNLATARAALRAKEVGVRKTLGASRGRLVAQFLCESTAVAFIALIAALVFVPLVLPLFNDITGKRITFDLTGDPFIPVVLLAFSLLVGLAAGSYPAAYLSRFAPSAMLKNSASSGASGALFRRGLVTVQFTISIILIIGTLIVGAQLDFLKERKLGFDADNVLALTMRDTSATAKLPVIKNELLRHPKVQAVAASNSIPGSFISKQLIRVESDSALADHGFQIMFVDPDFIDMMGIEILEGRGFSAELQTDETNAFIVNEAAVKKLGYLDPLGKRVQWGLQLDGSATRDGSIVGVVRDFHVQTLRRPVEPLVMMLHPSVSSYTLVRIDDEDIPATLAHINDVLDDLMPAQPFEYEFLDAYFNRQYRSEETMSRVFSYCSLLAIGIACLGLFGLSAFTAQRRSKEIGIRKVLGASTTNIVLLLSRETTLLIGISMLVAWPIAYAIMNAWLEDFAYRTTISWVVFIASGALAAVVGWLTIGYQALRAALANPADSILRE